MKLNNLLLLTGLATFVSTNACADMSLIFDVGSIVSSQAIKNKIQHPAKVLLNFNAELGYLESDNYFGIHVGHVVGRREKANLNQPLYFQGKYDNSKLVSTVSIDRINSNMAFLNFGKFTEYNDLYSFSKN